MPGVPVQKKVSKAGRGGAANCAQTSTQHTSTCKGSWSKNLQKLLYGFGRHCKLEIDWSHVIVCLYLYTGQIFSQLMKST